MSDVSSEQNPISSDPKRSAFLLSRTLKKPKNRVGLPGPVASIFLTTAFFFVSQIIGASQFVGYLLVLLLDQLKLVANAQQWFSESPLSQFLFIVVAEGLVIVFVVVLLKIRKVPLSVIGIGRPKRSVALTAVIGFFAFYALLIALNVILYYFIPELSNDQQQDIGFNNVQGSGLVLAFVSLCLLAPLGEEILMRGFLYTSLRKRMRFVFAALFTSLLFGLGHLNGGEGGAVIWTAATSTFLLSMVLVYIREKTGTIWAGVIIHSLNNVVAFGVHFYSALL